MFRLACTFLLFSFFLCPLSSQDDIQMIVFNREGKIVKSYAPENRKGIHIKYNKKRFHTFLVENVPDEDKHKYFLIYQYRINDNNHEPGIINIHEDVHIEQLEPTGNNREVLTLSIGKNRCCIKAKEDDDHGERDIVSYALIKLNIPENMPIPHVKSTLLSKFNHALLNNIESSNIPADSCLVIAMFSHALDRVYSKDSSIIKDFGLEKDFFDYINYRKHRNWLNDQFIRYWMKVVGLYSREKVLIMDFYKKAIFLRDKSVILSDLSIEELEICKENKFYEDTLKLKNDTLSLNRKKLKVLEERAKLLASSKMESVANSLNVLNRIIIDLSDEIFRLEADIKKLEIDKKEKCKKEIQSKIDRLTQSSIGKKFIACLENFPFLRNEAIEVLHLGYAIENNHQTKEVIYEADIRKKGDSDTLSLTFARQTPRLPQLTTDDRLFAKVINLTPELLLSNPFFLGMKVDQNTTVQEWEIANGPKIKLVEGNGLANLVNFGFGKSKDLPAALGTIMDKKSQSKDPKFFNKVYLTLRDHYIPSSRELNSYYIDYLLRFPNTFKYSSKPEITFSVEPIKLGTDSANPQNAYIDYFDPVRSRYSFSINTGVVFSQFTSYSYDSTLIEGTNDNYFLQERKTIERKVVPTVFLSYYPIANDIFDGNHDWSKFHIDVGVDINGTDVLNNVYLGVGFELHRYIQIVGGYRFGTHKRVDLNKVDSSTLDFSNLLKKEADRSLYFGIQLGYNIF